MKKMILMAMLLLASTSIFAQVNNKHYDLGAKEEVRYGVDQISRICPTFMWDSWILKKIKYDKEKNCVTMTIKLSGSNSSYMALSSEDMNETGIWIIENFMEGYKMIPTENSIFIDGDFMMYLSVGMLLRRMADAESCLEFELLNNKGSKVSKEVPIIKPDKLRELVTLDASAQVTKTESFDDLMTQAKWGDGNAYLKLADYYANGQNGTKPDLMKLMSMLTMAMEYGAINRPEDYFSKLPEDNITRMMFEAMESIDGSQKEKGLELANRLIDKGCADGYAILGFERMEMKDSIEATRLATLAAEQGSTLGRLLLHAIPYEHLTDIPDESVMVSLAETVPIFYSTMAEEFIDKLPNSPENDEKVMRAYLKADENGCLDIRGANWLLNYKKRGGNLQLSDTDLQRLAKLAEFRIVNDYECDEFEDDSWEDE